MYQLEELLNIASQRDSLTNINALIKGQRLGETPYVILKTLYRGDLSFTYLVKNTVEQREYVIKEFFPMSGFGQQDVMMSLKRNDDGSLEIKESNDEKLRVFHILKTKFKDDAEALKAYRDHYTVDVIETISANNTSYVVMNDVRYPSLNILLKQKLLTPNQAMVIFKQIAQTVKVIHKRGHVHKSLKPSNIYITDKNVIIGDYLVGNDAFVKRDHVSLYNDIYAAPEILHGEAIGRTSDIYALGKILEYLMEHIGYRSGEHKSIEMGKGFEFGIVDFILNKSLEEDPKKRIQSVDEILDLLNQKHRKPTKTLDVAKIILAILLSVVAVAMMIKADLPSYFLDQEVVQAEQPLMFITEEAPFRFTTKKVNYAFKEDIIFKWVDDVNDVYTVNIACASVPCHVTESFCMESIRVDDNTIDLSGLCLNPGEYIIEVVASDQRKIIQTIKVKAKETLADKQPHFITEGYGFYSDEDKVVEWEAPGQGFSHLVVYDINDQAILYDMILEQNNIDLDILDLNQGNYMFSIQSQLEHAETIYDHTHVKLLYDYEVKFPVLLNQDYDHLTLEDSISWLDIEGQVNIKFVHKMTQESQTIQCEQGVTEIKLNQYDLTTGPYIIYVTHVNDNKTSEVIKKEIEIVVQ